MSPVERKWHDDFIDYMDFIVSHSNYAEMPESHKEDGSVQWIVFGKSKLGQERFDWWDKKRQELDIPKIGHWRSNTARKNHPTSLKPCQVCGQVMNINYVYPNRTTVKRLNKVFSLDDDFVYDDFLDLKEIIEMLQKLFEEKRVLKGIAKVFKIPKKIEKNLESYISYILNQCKSRLSPGVMSNCPDRFDGFHTYNICCRSTQDTGRHAKNLARYGEDRRIYEYWADGDWKASGWLMKKINSIGEDGVCSICGRKGKVTADHLGPISLGFSVGDPPILRPACRSCNSGRNNRMTYNDINEILDLERDGIDVVSWHTRLVWKKLKRLPKNNKEAKKVSRFMRINLHYVITMLGLIAKAGFDDFLINQFLHPEYAYYSIKFDEFDPTTGHYKELVKDKGDRTEYRRNAERYKRKSIESIKRYLTKKNRKFPKDHMNEVKILAQNIVCRLEEDEEDNALEAIDKALKAFAEWAVADYNRRSFVQIVLSFFF